MTTLAKVEANRRNALQSTGPQTAAGKRTVAGNATSHGLSAAAALVPGESEPEWAEFESGVLASLAPIGVLEQELARRVAGLLWRLRRCQRYEVAVVTSRIEAATGNGVPAVPASDATLGCGREGPTRPRRVAEDARKRLGRVTRALHWLAGVDVRPDPEPVPSAVAKTVIGTAWVSAEQAGHAVPDPGTLAAELGHRGRRFEAVPWTAALVRQAVARYTTPTAPDPAAVLKVVGRELWAARLTLRRRLTAARRQVCEGEVSLRAEAARRATRLVLPDEKSAEKLQRHESHLGRQLQLALNQLERAQALRAGRPVPPPAAGTLSVLVEPTAPSAG